MTTTTELLPVAEAAALARCEATIARGVKTFVEVGAALTEIRDARLYRATHTSFDDYCRERWQFGRSQAYRLIDSAAVVANLSPIGDALPANEAQARPLAALPPDEQRAAWQQAVETMPGGKPTAAHVQQVVEARKPKPAAEHAYQVGATFWQALSANHPSAHHWTRERPDLYRTACGIVIQDRAPTGSIAAGHCSSCERLAAPAAPAELPPLPEPLRHDWLRWRDADTGRVVMTHTKTSYRISGDDAAALEAEARSLGLFLDELATFRWRVFADAGTGVAFTAQHETFSPIAAPTIERLALAAWRARLYEDDTPDMPDDVIDALFLQGWRWHGLSWSKGAERIEEDADLGQLRYDLGLDAPVAAAPVAQQPPASTPPGLLPAGYADAQKRAKGLGLYLDMNVKGEFSLTHEATGRAELAAGVTDFAVVLARLASRAAWVGGAPATTTTPADAAEGNVIDVARTLCERFLASDTEGTAAAFRGLAARLFGSLPARPRPPRSADVSAQVAYTTALERYASALEARLGVQK